MHEIPLVTRGGPVSEETGSSPGELTARWDVPGGTALLCADLLGVMVAAGPLAERAFVETVATQGIVAGTSAYVRAMVRFDRAGGRAPAEVIRELFPQDPVRVAAAQLAFDRAFRAALDRFGVQPQPGAEDALAKLAEGGIRVCVLTALPRTLASMVLERASWVRRADLLLAADEVPRFYPWPDPFLAAEIRIGVPDVGSVTAVTATEAGVLAARRAGAGMVVGVAGPGRAADRLAAAGAASVVADLGGLPALLGN